MTESIVSDGLARPFRLQPHAANADALAILNQKEGRVGDQAYLPWEDEIAQIEDRSAQGILGRRADAWIHHPDERVVCALIRARGRSVQRSPSTWGLALQRRGLETNQREGIFWNPVLDALSAGDAWPEAKNSMRLMAGSSGVPRTQDWGPKPEELVERLVPWIEAQDDLHRLHDFLAFDSPWVHAAVAEHGRCLDGDLVSSLLGRNPNLHPAIAANASLSSEALHAAYGWLLNGLATSDGSDEVALLFQFLDRLDEAGRSAPRTLVEEALERVPQMEHHWLKERIWKFIVRQRDLNDDLLLRTLLTGAYTHDIAKVMLHPAATPELWDRALAVYRHPVALAHAVLLDRGTPPHVLLRVLPLVRKHEGMLLLAVSHPKADKAVHRMTAGVTGNSKVRMALIKGGHARDPEVRKSLLKSNSAEVLMALLGDAETSAEEFERVFRKLVSKGPETALHALEQKPIPRGVRLPSSDLLPLFESAEPEVRERALRALSRVQASSGESPLLNTDVHAPPPTANRRGRRT